MNNKKDIQITGNEIIQLALILGIIIIAASGNDGWGWLVFILIVARM